MVISRHHVFFLSAMAAVVALTAGHFPTSNLLDRVAFRCLSKGIVPAPTTIAGTGTRETPWMLASRAAPKTNNRTAIVSLGDDREGLFQSTPPAPLDFAVLLKNFPRLGPDKAAIAATLVWDAPDPLGLAALEKTLASFSAIATTSPLSRGAVADPLPPSYLRASLPISSLRGDVSLLPVVNRVPFEGIVLGGENALSGFQSIDSENNNPHPHLIARWKDRAVFSFPVIATLVKLGLPVEKLQVTCGSHLRFGKNGPVVPIDSFGRFSGEISSSEPSPVIPAGTLLDSFTPTGNFPKDTLLVLRDDRSNVPPAAREFATRLASTLTLFSSPSQTRMFPRLPVVIEWLLLGTLCMIIIACFLLYPRAKLSVSCISLAVMPIVSWSGLHYGSIWLPLFPSLFAIVIGATLIPLQTLLDKLPRRA